MNKNVGHCISALGTQHQLLNPSNDYLCMRKTWATLISGVVNVTRSRLTWLSHHTTSDHRIWKPGRKRDLLEPRIICSVPQGGMWQIRDKFYTLP